MASVQLTHVILAGFFIFVNNAVASEVTRRIAIEWQAAPAEGEISVTGGSLSDASAGRFTAPVGKPFRFETGVRGSDVRYGPGAAIVTVKTQPHSFSFFLRDARKEHPVFLPSYGVVITDAADRRTYNEIVQSIRSQALRTKLQQIEAEPEENWESAAANTRNVRCQTWLGLSRDMRIFAVSERLDWIQPRFHGTEVGLPETDGKPCRYNLLMGRGWGPRDQITRRLEDGILPILNGMVVDGDIRYEMTTFVTPEAGAFTGDAIRGTHFLVADGHGLGHMFTKNQQAEYDRLLPGEMNRPDETVLCMRVSAVNSARVPRYAFFKNPAPSVAADYILDGATGMATYKTGRVFAVSTINGTPLSQEEVAIELEPGERADFEVFLPHRPIPRDRAQKLRSRSFEERHSDCRRFWQAKLNAAAKVRVPETRITEMMQAGLLHLDLITYGLEPRGTLTSTIGVYSAIGSESAPIIQFMDSMGRHDVARRALMYFLDKQHEDGFIQNFGGYMLETGAALWSLGEHYRYTRDKDWVREIEPKVVKACEFLHRWRERNLRDDLKNGGYGMLEGKTADPEDPFRSFMLNGYAYLGLSRTAEMLAGVDPTESRRWEKEALALKADIREAMFRAMGNSPVIPLADGTWCPTLSPWVEYRGPLALYGDGGKWFTHGSMVSRDSLLGPIYLIFQEVVNPGEPAADFLLNFHNDLMTDRNVAFSQPYYSRHPIAHLRRGEVKPFLKAYYNTLSSLADRDTYTFWEHFFGASPHKTHEEGWFLMDSRWMLYMEQGQGLTLLAGIPRSYLDAGKSIDLKDVSTYFGPLSLRVDSRLDQGRIHASVECASGENPKYIDLRLPHPRGLKASRATGGTYDAATERVHIEPFEGRAEVTLSFGQ